MKNTIESIIPFESGRQSAPSACISITCQSVIVLDYAQIVNYNLLCPWKNFS